MKTIWKATIKCDALRGAQHTIDVPAPADAEPLSVALQHSSVCVWFLCDPQAPPSSFRLLCVGTGWGAAPESREGFLGTVVQGDSVWHLWRTQ